MKDFKIIIIILLTFGIPLLTSWVLDWNWINNSWPRIVLIILLMLFELITGIFLLIEILKKN